MTQIPEWGDTSVVMVRAPYCEERSGKLPEEVELGGPGLYMPLT